MNNSLDRVFNGIVESLKSEVIPRLSDEFARGQAYAAIDLLQNLRPRIDWAVAPLTAQIQSQRAALTRIAERARGLKPAAPMLPADLLTAELPCGGAELKALRDRLDELLSAVIGWLPAQKSSLAVDDIRAALALHMKEQVRRDVSLTAKPLFGEIAGNASA